MLAQANLRILLFTYILFRLLVNFLILALLAYKRTLSMDMFYELELENEEESPYGKDPEKDWEFLLGQVQKYAPDADIQIIEKAYRYCLKYHGGVSRKSGLPYYTHPLNVTFVLLEEFNFKDTSSLAACLLHDIIEDVESIKKATIIEEFNEDIAEIVDAVTKISHQKIYSSVEKNDKISKIKSKAATYRKLFLALVKDFRVIQIKLADRLHNMRTLHYLPEAKQKEISRETINFYTPLAHRLGLTKVKTELENRSFYFYDRPGYEAIRNSLNEKRREFIDYIRVFSGHIQNNLNDNGLDHILSVIHKHEYEIYKMIQDGTPLSEIDNFYSMVIILKTNKIPECYRALGILANAFNTVSFIDYIANPKIDWYKSLKTELIGPDGRRVEILIRTEEMEKIAEEGFASKFSFKNKRFRALKLSDEELERWGEWMQDIIEEKGEDAAQIIWDAIKVNLFDSELTVFTRNGQAVDLPEGASLLDLAFAISEEKGLHCVGGKIAGKTVDLDYKLEDRDQIELISSPNIWPHQDWLSFVNTQRAVVALHFYFKNVPAKKLQEKKQKENFEVKLKVKGEDRENMLIDISQAIGQTNIRRINLDTTGSFFEGVIIVKVENDDLLNKIIAKMLGIEGLRAVYRLEDT